MKRLDLEFFNEVLPKAVPGLQVVTLRQGYSVDRAQTRFSLDCIIDDMAVALLGRRSSRAMIGSSSCCGSRSSRSTRHSEPCSWTSRCG